MKKTTLKVIIMLCMISISEFSFADWRTDSKNTRICVGWRWWARSKVSYICVDKSDEQQTSRKCSGTAQAYSRVGAPGGSRAEAQGWSSSSRSQGWAFTNVPCLLPGYDPNALFQKNLLNTTDTEESFAKQDISNNMEFTFPNENENYSYTVSGSSLSGYMLLSNTSSTDYYSVYDIIIWKDNVDEGVEYSDINPEDIEWRSTITLTKDGVIGTGIFETDQYYSIHETDSGRLLIFNLDENLEVNLTNNGDTKYRLTTRGHVGYNPNNNTWVTATTQSLMRKLEQENLSQNNLKELNTYPNPTTKELNFEVTTISDEKLEIEIYNSNGQLIDKIYKGTTENGKKKVITSDVLINAPVGIYQIKYRVGNKTFFRQIIKD